MRDACGKSVADQLRLARWCRHEGLDEQCRAHLQAVLSEQPNHLLARRALGHEWFYDRWYFPTEINAAQAMSDRYCRNLQEWLPNLERLIKRLNSSSEKSRRNALDELAGIDDPGCLAAFECLLPTVSADVARLLINKISLFRSQETCLMLVRVALSSTSRPKLHALAIRELRKYHADHYVPELLQLLTVPASVSSAFVNLPNGDLALQRFVLRELLDRKELHRYTKYVNTAEVQSFHLETTVRPPDNDDTHRARG
jgi:hypothetical protein